MRTRKKKKIIFDRNEFAMFIAKEIALTATYMVASRNGNWLLCDGIEKMVQANPLIGIQKFIFDKAVQAHHDHMAKSDNITKKEFRRKYPGVVYDFGFAFSYEVQAARCRSFYKTKIWPMHIIKQGSEYNNLKHFIL